VLILALQLALPYRTPLPADQVLAPRRPRPISAAQLPTYSTLLQQPIFAPDRSPGGSGIAGGGAKGPGSLDEVTVTGIALAPGSAMAVVRTPAGSQTIKPGQTLAGWRLVGMDAAHLSFARDHERRILTLGQKKPASGGASQQTSDDDDDDDEG
jgi:hypothetical protein